MIDVYRKPTRGKGHRQEHQPFDQVSLASLNVPVMFGIQAGKTTVFPQQPYNVGVQGTHDEQWEDVHNDYLEGQFDLYRCVPVSLNVWKTVMAAWAKI